MPFRIPVSLVVLAAGLTLGVVAVAVATGPAGRSSDRPQVARRVTGPGETRALTVLRAWDERRSEAWADGDPAALGRLYVHGSGAGLADVSLLKDYLRRGLVVRGLRMQLLRAAVLVDRPQRVVVRVTERLAGVEVRVDDRAVRLPRDSAQVHVVDLRQVGRVWRVAAVR